MNQRPKICFFLQRNYAYTGHEIARWLKEKYGVTEFCAYVGLRRMHTFLKSQKDIAYSTLVLEEEVYGSYKQEKLDLPYLQWLEKEFGLPNLWPYIALDRVLMFNQLVREYPYNTPNYTHEEMLRILQITAKAVIVFLDTERPDAIVFSTVGNISTYLLHEIARRRGIKILNILTVPLRDRFTVSERFDSFTGAEKIFKKYQISEPGGKYYTEAKKILEEFRSSPYPYLEQSSAKRQPVNREKQLRFLQPRNFIRSISWFARLSYDYVFGETRSDYTTIHPMSYVFDRVKRKLRNLYGVSDLYDTYHPTEPYAYFALHYEPEISLMLLAPFAQDQIHLVKQVARSLPVGWKLYVKDHPEMIQFRPRSYYQELKKIPNVQLISPSVNGLTLIAHARLICTVTGSAAWEGLLLKKPAIVFGNQFYNILSMIKKCESLETLPYIVKEQLETFNYREEELLFFIAAILDDSAVLPFVHIWEQETDAEKRRAGLEPLADLIAKKLGIA